MRTNSKDSGKIWLRDWQRGKILVRATNENNQSVENLVTISISNAFDDIDGDGISDTSDSDIDGDGLQWVRREHGFDPYDPLSKIMLSDIVPSSSLVFMRKGWFNYYYIICISRSSVDMSSIATSEGDRMELQFIGRRGSQTCKGVELRLSDWIQHTSSCDRWA